MSETRHPVGTEALPLFDPPRALARRVEVLRLMKRSPLRRKTPLKAKGGRRFKNAEVDEVYNVRIYEDGSTPMEMALLDANNFEWYPNTKKVRKLVKKRQAAKQAVKDELTAIWLDSFEDE